MDTVPANDYSAAQQRLATLRAELDREVARARTRRTVMIVVGIVLLLIVIVYLWFIWSVVKEYLYAETLVDLTQQQVQPYMEEGPQNLATMLREQAPTVMDHAERYALQAPEMIGNQARELILQRMHGQLETLENDFYEQVRTTLIDRVEQHAQEAGVDLNDPQQIEREIPALAERIGDAMEGHVERVYGDYQRVADQFIDHLHYLARGEELSREDRIHRQLVISFLAMMQKSLEERDFGLETPRFRLQMLGGGLGGLGGGQGGLLGGQGEGVGGDVPAPDETRVRPPADQRPMRDAGETPAGRGGAVERPVRQPDGAAAGAAGQQPQGGAAGQQPQQEGAGADAERDAQPRPGGGGAAR